jgi:hypothetical protein
MEVICNRSGNFPDKYFFHSHRRILPSLLMELKSRKIMKNSISTTLPILKALLLSLVITVATAAQPTSPNYSNIIFSPSTQGHYWYGISTESAGDFNDDGFDDVLISSPYPGVVYMCFGSNNMDNIPDLVFSNNNYAKFGWRVNCAGDVNGDGIADIVIGERHYNEIGAAYIYLGNSTPDITPDVFMTGEETILGRFGYMVSSAGNVNGDGYDDVIITDHYFGNQTGRAYLFLGGAAMDNTPDVIMTGENQGDWFGNSCSSAGDINNDGYDDFLVSAVKYGTDIGNCYLYFGGSSVDNIPDLTFSGNASTQLGIVSGAGDLNGDQYDDFIIAGGMNGNRQGIVFVYFGGSTPDNISDFAYHGESEFSQFGFGSSPCGDINRDGYQDILIGAYQYNNLRGRAYVYYGGSFLHDIPNIRLSGNTAYEERFSYSTGAADVDNDSVPEILAGAYYRNAYGGAYLFDNFRDTKISGSDVCITNSSPVPFTAPFMGGTWSLVNFGSSAGILEVWDEKVAIVYPGGTGGRFVLQYTSNDSVYTCTKSVRVEVGLPVEISLLDASVFERNNVLLNWTTLWEMNNAGFSVERKKQYGSWTPIGFVEGVGNSTDNNDYTFADRQLASGHYSYRLVQQDYNGATAIFEFSGLLTVGVPAEFSMSQNFPNPFNPVTRIEFIARSQTPFGNALAPETLFLLLFKLNHLPVPHMLDPHMLVPKLC